MIRQLPPRGAAHGPGGLREALRDRNVYAIAVAWFGIACGIYAVAFWMPVMLRSAGVATASQIGFWSVIPYGASALGMILLSRHSDRSGERRWHAATCTFAGAVALAMIPYAGQSPRARGRGHHRRLGRSVRLHPRAAGDADGIAVP